MGTKAIRDYWLKWRHSNGIWTERATWLHLLSLAGSFEVPLVWALLEVFWAWSLAGLPSPCPSPPLFSSDCMKCSLCIGPPASCMRYLVLVRYRQAIDKRSSDATKVECASAPRLPRALKVERSASTLTRSNRHVINCSRFLDSRGHRKVTESNSNQSILSFERAHTLTNGRFKYK